MRELRPRKKRLHGLGTLARQDASESGLMANGRRDSRHKHPKQPNATGNTPQKTPDPKPYGFDITPLGDKIDGLVAAYTTAQQDSNEHANKHLFWNRVSSCATIAAFAAAAIYATITYKANELTKRALKTSTTQFQRDQRPYVVIDDLAQATGSTISVGKRTFWNVNYSNYGKSPAIKCVLMMKMFIGKPVDNLKAVDSWWVTEIQGKTLSGPESVLAPNGFGAMPPDTTPNPHATDWHHKPKGQGYSTTGSDGPLRVQDVSLINSTFHALIVTGRVQYYDLAGKAYTTDFCFGTGPNGVVAGCPTHNDIQ
jgi:hypothetical protein